MAWGTLTRERRVLKAGHSSIAVTLPKPWAEAMNLRPGDLVVFDQNDDGTLYLKPAPVAGTPSVESPYVVRGTAFDEPGLLSRLLVGAYRVGHDAIEIHSERPFSAERVEELLEAARGLLGVSVVAQESNRIVLQNFVDPSKYEMPQLVQRMRMILVAFLEEADTIVARRTPSRRLSTLNDEIHKVLALLVRQQFLASRDWSLARRIGTSDPRQLLEWRVVVHSLEEVGRLLSECVDELNRGSKGSAAIGPAIRSLLSEIKSTLNLLVESLMRPTLKGACDAHAETVQLAQSARSQARSFNASVRKTPVYAAWVALGRAAASLQAIADVAVDRAVASGNETMMPAVP
jgi:AbrB family looped-hinge helix DNA binding protein